MHMWDLQDGVHEAPGRGEGEEEGWGLAECDEPDLMSPQAGLWWSPLLSNAPLPRGMSTSADL